MNSLLIICSILPLYKIKCFPNIFNHIGDFTINHFLPFYNFSLHDTPVILTNDTVLIEEARYYNEMRKIGTLHVIGSSVPTVISVTGSIIGGTMLFTYGAPLSFLYMGYHIYLTHKSAHLEQKLNFLISEDHLTDMRFSKGWTEYLRLPRFLFKPWIFAISLYSLLIVVVWKNIKRLREIKTIESVKIYCIQWAVSLLVLLFVIYFFSFLQMADESNKKLTIKDDFIREELRWKCHVRRMTFMTYITKLFKTLFSLQTDERGYSLDKDCRKLELELYDLEEPTISIVYKTFVRSFTAIIKELFQSLEMVDKILLITLTVVFVLYRPDKLCTQVYKRAFGKKIQKKIINDNCDMEEVN